MKIYHVNLARGFSGGEQQTLELIKQHKKENKPFAVIALANSPFFYATKKLGYEVIAVRHYLLGHTLKLPIKAILHVHEGHAIYWAAIQNRISSTPYIITRRIDNPIKNKRLSMYAYSHAAAIVGISNRVSEIIKEHFPKQYVVTIPDSPVDYPVNQQSVSKIKQQFKNKFLVIQAGNMIPHKGFDVTINAAKELNDNNIHICLLGDGKQRADLEQQAKILGVTNISFMGKQNNMGDWFTAADLLIHPSYTEGLGSVILEAMNMGLPAIGSRTGGIPDILQHEESGLLIEPGNTSELANSIERIAHNESLRTNLIIRGHKKLASFMIAHTAKLYSNLYQYALSND